MRETLRKPLFPSESGNPALRLAKGMALAALAMALAVMLLQTFISVTLGMGLDGLYDRAANSFEEAGKIAVIFAGTLGLAGVVSLWFFGIRNMVAWAFMGGTLGAIGGAILGASNPTEFGAATLGGWAMFLLIRWFAGVRD